MSGGEEETGHRVYPLAHPGEVHKGDIVRWFDFTAQRDRDGVVVRVARDGSWAEVRYEHAGVSSPRFPRRTHLTRRVPVTSLRVVGTRKN
jgi:hypothetical protein